MSGMLMFLYEWCMVYFYLKCIYTYYILHIMYIYIYPVQFIYNITQNILIYWSEICQDLEFKY